MAYIIETPWPQFKSFVDARTLSVQWLDINDNYYLSAHDGPFTITCLIPKVLSPGEGTPQKVFEDSYKAAGNKSFSDIDGTPLARQKASKRGWSFWAVPIELTTSFLQDQAIYAKDAGGTDIPGITVKIYNAQDQEITTPGVANANLLTAVKTVLDFEPAFDYEMIGGVLRIHSNPSEDVRLWIVGAPDIPAQLGGSKEFASGVNLKFLAPDSAFEIDGRVTKYVTYNSQTRSGKLRVIIKHPAGLRLNMQVIIHTYRA